MTKPIKLVAAQEDKDGYKNKTGNLTVSRNIKLKADGSLEVVTE